MNSVGWLLVVGGLVTAMVGGLLLVGGRLGLGRLPGDLSRHANGMHVYVPLASMLLLSAIVTVVLNLFLRR